MAERDHREENGVPRRPEVEGVGLQRIAAAFREGTGGELIGGRVAESGGRRARVRDDREPNPESEKEDDEERLPVDPRNALSGLRQPRADS
jgi:hypothetical protein